MLPSLIRRFLSAGIINRRNHLKHPSSHPGKQNRPSGCHRRRRFTGDARPSRTHNWKSNECTTAVWMCVKMCIMVCFCFPSGQSATKGAEFEANGGFHVQRAEEAGLRRGFPLALPVHRLIIMMMNHCFFPDNLIRVNCADKTT